MLAASKSWDRLLSVVATSYCKGLHAVNWYMAAVLVMAHVAGASQ
jgi:hypothetical protein